MTKEELKEKIANWLTKQGYPLEMKVARAFQEAGFSVSSSEYYLDPDENKLREIDVVASMNNLIDDIIFQVVYTAECKSSKKNPWVCFCSTNSSRDSSIGFFARYATIQGHVMLTELSFNPDITTADLFYLPGQYAYGVMNAFKDKLDVPYQAIQGARKSSQAIVAHYDKGQALPNKIQTVCVAFPLVVVNAPLFDCKLDESGELELHQVDHETILRTGFDAYYSVVEIVDASALETYLKTKADLIAHFLKNLRERIPATLRQIDVANMTKE